MVQKIKGTTKEALIVGAIIIAFLVYLSTWVFTINKPAPRGILGEYYYNDDQICQTEVDKDTLLHTLEKNGLLVKSGRLNEYDAPWDSLDYLIGNITCDAEKIDAYIEFQKGRENRVTKFQISRIHAAPNNSYDTLIYNSLRDKYYECVKQLFKQHGIQFNSMN